ncbi:hypothetical protein [Burkholderia humptydooensis]|uniref:hypothetical protein n=1 Tax=Burkholderia humptydooensis TaxID=430531 RepID=UPI0010FDC4A9|nr:hypothetical protein [Burkholderia humptydooensis]
MSDSYGNLAEGLPISIMRLRPSSKHVPAPESMHSSSPTGTVGYRIIIEEFAAPHVQWFGSVHTLIIASNSKAILKIKFIAIKKKEFDES